MANVTTSATNNTVNTVNTTDNNMLQTIFSAIANISLYLNIAEVKALLIESGLFNVERKTVVRVEKTRVAGKKGKKGSKCKTKVKRTPVYQTETVVDTAAVNRFAKLVVAANKVAVAEAAKAAFHARNAERAEAKAFALDMEARKAELRHIDSQIAALRAVKVRRTFTKTNTVKSMTIKTRTTQKPARLRVARVQSCFIGKLAPVAIPTREITVSREEAQALLAAIKVRSFASKATSTMEVISAFDRVDSLIAAAISTITKVGSFVAKARAIVENTKNSLPEVAQYMTMSLSQKDILIAIHNAAMDDMGTQINDNDYEDAVLECYEEVLHQMGVAETDELFEAVCYMASTNCYVNDRGDGNLSKNVTTDEGNPSSVTPVNTTNDSQAMNYINASAFANASAFNHNDGAEPHYSEVAPLVNFGDAEEIINFDGEGKSFAEMLASIMYPMEEAMFFDSDTEEVRAQIQATVDHKNARASEAQEKFLGNFGSKLGFIHHVTLEYAVGGSYARASYNLKSHFESLFTMAQLPQYENAETVYSGLELDEFAPRIKVGDANALWLAILAKATYNLTVEERAQLLGLLFHNVAKVEGTVISRDKISIDVANATVTTGNGRVLRANKASCFGNAGGFIVIDGLQSIFLFGLQALGGTAKQLETSINLAVKLFQPEHNYGHKPDADDMAHFVRTNFVYTNAVNSTGMNFPSIEIIGGKQNPDFLGWVLGRGVVATCDKTNIKFVTINAGAEAVGVGYSRDEFGNLDQMFTANDANKPTKLFNRAAANNYDCAELPNRVASNFGFALSNGNVARTKGVMMNVAYTNSLLTMGSGVAIINPETKFSFSIGKKEKQPTNLSMFGYKATNNANFKKSFVAGIEKRIAELKGETFGPSEVMLFVELNGKRYDLVSNTEEAADVTVKGGYVRNNVLDENSVEIVLEVDLIGETGFVKTRRFATKFTTTPFEAEFSVAGEWDIILNNECTKGHGALLEMFANATGERFLNNSTCMFTTPDGDSFDVRGTDNAFYAWRDANIQKDVTLTLSIAKSVWENVKRFCGKTVRVIAETTDMNGYPVVVVEETVDVIFGQLVFDVEISSPLESVSNSSLTLESASAIYLQSQRLGNILFEQCLSKADKFVQLAANFAGTDRDDMAVIDLDDEASFNSFLASVPACGDGSLTQSQLVAALAVKYPAGIQFFLGKLEFAVNLGLVATFGQFNRLNGSAARETAEIVNFLLDVIYNGASDKDLMINAKRAFAKIVRTGIDSKKVLKKPTRSGKLIYGKVRTSFAPMLHSEDGIPTVVMNINCPMVRMLGIPTDGSIVNYYVGFARTPMPFLGGARVRLTDDASICDVAHVLVDPYVWHCLNEGDSDGDGIAVMNLSALNFTQEEIREMNNSVMGIAGYEHLYGDAVPFADFMSEEDKAGKKSFRGVLTLMSTQVKNPDTGKKVDITANFVADFAGRVANHYKSAVGTSYGICSKLVFQAADLAAAGPSEKLDTVLTACLIAWRSMYEGLGLSGYSANAARVFEILMLASNNVRTGKVHVHPITGAVGNAYGKPEAELVDGAEVLRAEFPNLDVSNDVYHTLITSRCATRMAVKLEGYGNLSNYWLETPGLEEAGIKYGALRRISQGDDRVAEELGLMEEARIEATGEYVGKTATRLFNDTVIVEECFTNLLLGEVAATVCEFHALLVETKQSAIDAEQAGH